MTPGHYDRKRAARLDLAELAMWTGIALAAAAWIAGMLTGR